MSMPVDKLTPEREQTWQETFIIALSESPNVAAACRIAGISREYAYRMKREDAEFAKVWDDALESSTDDLAGEAYRRARHGTERPVYFKDKELTRIREYSDALTMFLLRAHRPSVYRETIDQTQVGTSVIRVEYADVKPIAQIEHHSDSAEAPPEPNADSPGDEAV
jgi:hypothetical protein